jgi:hypothetical protein
VKASRRAGLQSPHLAERCGSRSRFGTAWMARWVHRPVADADSLARARASAIRSGSPPDSRLVGRFIGVPPKGWGWCSVVASQVTNERSSVTNERWGRGASRCSCLFGDGICRQVTRSAKTSPSGWISLTIGPARRPLFRRLDRHQANASGSAKHVVYRKVSGVKPTHERRCVRQGNYRDIRGADCFNYWA